jgi:hypothetical protein
VLEQLQRTEKNRYLHGGDRHSQTAGTEIRSKRRSNGFGTDGQGIGGEQILVSLEVKEHKVRYGGFVGMGSGCGGRKRNGI